MCKSSIYRYLPSSSGMFAGNLPQIPIWGCKTQDPQFCSARTRFRGIFRMQSMLQRRTQYGGTTNINMQLCMYIDIRIIYAHNRIRKRVQIYHAQFTYVYDSHVHTLHSNPHALLLLCLALLQGLWPALPHGGHGPMEEWTAGGQWARFDWELG